MADPTLPPPTVIPVVPAATISDSAFRMTAPTLSAVVALSNGLSAPAISDRPFQIPLAPALVEAGPSGGVAPPSVAERLIEQKHAEYIRLTRRYQFLYFTTRCTAALCAVLLPFVIGAAPRVATGMSIAVAVCIAVDMVFSPKDLWVTYSKATDLLGIARLKQLGEYEKYKDALDVLMNTEAARLQRVKDIGEVLNALESGRKG